LEFISGRMKVELGTGSTVTLFIRELGRAVQGGFRIEAIVTNQASSALAKELRILLTTFDETLVLEYPL
jgi:ribose 5-phosphate isomerase A